MCDQNAKEVKEDKAPLEAKIQNWLSKNGYPLEFHTAAVFENVGFSTNQSQYVTSTSDQKAREVDVSAYYFQGAAPDPRLGDRRPALGLELVIECKHSEKPWIVFSTETALTVRTARVAQNVATDLGEALLWCACEDRTLAELPIFSEGKRVGIGLVEAFKDRPDNDRAYDAMQKICSAVFAKRDSMNSTIFRVGRLPIVGAVFFPVIVVDSPLFEAYRGEESDQLTLEAVSSAKVRWGGLGSFGTAPMIHVVTKDQLPQFAAAMMASFKELLKALVESRYPKVKEALLNDRYSMLEMQDRVFRGVSKPRIFAYLGE